MHLIFLAAVDAPELDDLDLYLRTCPETPASSTSSNTQLSPEDLTFLNDLSEPFPFTLSPSHERQLSSAQNRKAFPSQIVYEIRHKQPFHWKSPQSKTKRMCSSLHMYRETLWRQAMFRLHHKNRTFGQLENHFWKCRLGK